MVDYRAAKTRGRRVCAAARRLWLYARIPDRAAVPRHASANDPRRHHRNNEGDYWARAAELAPLGATIVRPCRSKQGMFAFGRAVLYLIIVFRFCALRAQKRKTLIQEVPCCRRQKARLARQKKGQLMAEAFIYAAIRTPRGKGKPDGSLHEVKPVALLTGLMHELQRRMQLNRFCASGLEAVNLAAMKVRSDWEDLVVAGGVESMSRVPMGSDGGAIYADPATSLAIGFVPQGIGADLIATLDGFSREDVDHFACESQRKATQARANCYFSKSLVPVNDSNGLPILAHDEFIKPQTNMNGLAKLQPSFA